MREGRRSGKQRVVSWRGDDLPDFEDVRRRLPVSEQSLIPVAEMGRGPCVQTAVTEAVTLVRSRISGPSVGVNVLKPEYVSFMIPSPATRDCHINGQAVRSGLIFPMGSDREFYLKGGRRDLLAMALSRSEFIETLAALRGIDSEDLAFDSEGVVVAPRVHARLFRTLEHMVSSSMHRTAREFSNEVFLTAMDTYLHAKPHQPPSARSRSGSATRIVCRAEERFASAEGGPVSLADLCLAAGVGKSTLYRAFHSVCGEPPLSYFHRRRMVKARSRILRATPARGAVKVAALGVGLTELGRFSVEYRRLFGESPSATLGAALR